MAETTMLNCEVAYALPDRQHVIELQLPTGSTVRDALIRSGLCEQHPEITLARIEAGPLAIGIFGRIVPLDRQLQEADRVEIYRPLAAEPRAARRLRVKRGPY